MNFKLEMVGVDWLQETYSNDEVIALNQRPNPKSARRLVGGCKITPFVFLQPLSLAAHQHLLDIPRNVDVCMFPN